VCKFKIVFPPPPINKKKTPLKIDANATEWVLNMQIQVHTCGIINSHLCDKILNRNKRFAFSREKRVCVRFYVCAVAVDIMKVISNWQLLSPNSISFSVCCSFSSCLRYNSPIAFTIYFTAHCFHVCTYLPLPVILFCFLRLSSSLQIKFYLSIYLSSTV